MTNVKDGKLLTQVGPGRLMGEFMRQYWHPVAMSSELSVDGDPLRITLLGEKLIAFRDTSGKIGIMDHRCPHRCASLFFGRNEKNGIRCVYHGWKFDTEGNCIDMPNVAKHQDFKGRIKAKAYKTEERNGITWVFMGDQSKIPPLPMIESNLLPEEQALHRFILRDCNYLQTLEGDIDQTHLAFLHLGNLYGNQLERENPTLESELTRMVIEERGPENFAVDTDWGTMLATYRKMNDSRLYWRISQFLMPYWTMPSNRVLEDHVVARAWVPMDDTHTMFVAIGQKGKPIVPTKTSNGEEVTGLAAEDRFQPNYTGWFDRWRFVDNSNNDYGIDREQQRSKSYSGIDGIHLQDQAITESMGPIVDHAFEHLAPADVMITQTRRRLINAVRALGKDGTSPPGIDDHKIYLRARGGGMFTESGADWRKAYDAKMKQWLL